MKTCNCRFTAALLVLFCLAAPLCCADVVISPDTETTIVVGHDASETELFAAAELQKYIRRIIGTTVPIANAEDDVKGVVLSVGNNKYGKVYESRFSKSIVGPGPDSFVISVKDDLVILAGGGDRGTLYSVYEFLA